MDYRTETIYSPDIVTYKPKYKRLYGVMVHPDMRNTKSNVSSLKIKIKETHKYDGTFLITYINLSFND